MTYPDDAEHVEIKSATTFSCAPEPAPITIETIIAARAKLESMMTWPPALEPLGIPLPHPFLQFVVRELALEDWPEICTCREAWLAALRKEVEGDGCDAEW